MPRNPDRKEFIQVAPVKDDGSVAEPRALKRAAVRRSSTVLA